MADVAYGEADTTNLVKARECLVESCQKSQNYSGTPPDRSGGWPEG